jgi:S-adenosylmethionine hydrolase
MACITLLSDFGLQDASVAIAKGTLVQQAPGVTIMDISHEVKPFYAPQAAYLLSAAYKNFPPGTCHIILFDLFSEKPSRIILSEHNSQYFLSPDNGLLPIALGAGNISSWLYFEMNASQTFIDWLKAAGQAANLLQERNPAGLGLPDYKLKSSAQKTPQLSGQGFVACEVMHIDQYENVVVNITRHQFEELAKGRSFSIRFMEVEEINTMSSNYTDVREGFKLCRFNSNGYLEICINRGKAASLFGLRQGSRHNGIKIFFE